MDFVRTLLGVVVTLLVATGGIIAAGAYFYIALLIAKSTQQLVAVVALVLLAGLDLLGVLTYAAPRWTAGWIERSARYARPMAFAYVLGRFSASMATIMLTVAGAIYGYIWLRSATLSQGALVSAVVVATAFAGAMLFAFRLYARAMYGCTEALVGLIIAGERASAEVRWPIENLNFDLAILTAGVYLVVRGLDNVHEGFKARMRNDTTQLRPQILRGRRESAAAFMRAIRRN